MEIIDFLTPDRIILDLRPRDKSHLLAEVGRLFARSVPALQPDAVAAALIAREQLGSTGLGNGFALPHARVDGATRYLGMFLRLAKPIDFQAIDSQPVRLVFGLLLPAESTVPHVAALAAISRRLRDPGLVANLGKAETAASVYALLTGS